jgi:hypothetical protein
MAESNLQSTPTGIPVSLRFAFQEYDLEQLDLVAQAFTIIERTLAYGNRAELRWLFDTYGPARLVEWLQQDGWRTLPKRRLNLWLTYFNLPPMATGRSIWPY